MYSTDARVVRNNIPDVMRVVAHAEESIPRNLSERTRDYAKTIVPVLQGFLQDSIKSVRVRQGVYQVTARSTEGGADRDYAHYVEYGTSKMAPQPFMRPSYVWMKRIALQAEAARFGVAVEIAAVR